MVFSQIKPTICPSAIGAESAHFPGGLRLLQLQNKNRNVSKNRARLVICSVFQPTADPCFYCNSISRHSGLKRGGLGWTDGRRNARAAATVCRVAEETLQRCSEKGGKKVKWEAFKKYFTSRWSAKVLLHFLLAPFHLTTPSTACLLNKGFVFITMTTDKPK